MRKKLLWLLAGVLFVGFSPATSNLTDKERSFAISSLKESKRLVIQSLKGLSENQLQYKPSPESWSIAECIKHIAVAENVLWEQANAALSSAENPVGRNKIEITDQQLVNKVQNREQKIRAIILNEPKNTPYSSVKDALEDFINNRGELIRFMKTSDENMRNHVSKTPMGIIDAYQMIILISSHTNRHVMQILEIKAANDFPED